MCELKLLTYSCGHTEYTRTGDPCPSSRRSKITPATEPPDFCFAKISIVQAVSSPKACKPECRRSKALNALLRRYREAYEKLETLVKRVEAIRVCLTDSKMPMYDFSHLVDKGWNAEMLRSRCKASFTNLHSLIADFWGMKKVILLELEDAYSAAKATIREYQVEVKVGTMAEVVSVDVETFETRCEDLRLQLHDIVLEIERRASDACLEELGWKIPTEDEIQYNTLLELAMWKKGVLSGSRMCDAYTGT